MSQDPKLQRLSEALTEHSPEGIAILTAEPSRLTRISLLLVAALVAAGLIWSLIGRADVMVTARGELAPDSEVRRIYAPIDGELVDRYLVEGVPVNEGDVVARINARSAIQAATQAQEAKLELAEAERESAYFPERRTLMEQQAKALARQIEAEEKLYNKRLAEGLSKLAEAQRVKLQEVRANLDQARRDRDRALEELQKFRRLHARPGGGGVSGSQVQEKESTYLGAESNHRLAQAALNALDFELSEETAKAMVELDNSDQRLTELRIQRKKLLDDIENEAVRVQLKLQAARLTAEAAARVSFDNIDEENFLQIKAPVSGVITQVAFTQPGDKIQANTPLGNIAPSGAQAVLKVEIAESDRGFLREGLPAKLKFNAFPFQRYGLILGTLDYVSPATQASSANGAPVYKGRISLERDYFEVGDVRYPLRYGMAATAEIVVRKRRIIDLALDPFRKL